jgi:peptidoglycan L-alanyl-D-glutamate endopeptidase CwlK
MSRDNDVAHLHPAFVAPLLKLEEALQAEDIPLALYEGARSPFRQAELYARGRGVGQPGKFATRAKAWQSFHQFGIAADFVFLVNGAWTWDEPRPGLWNRYGELARAAGLRCLDFERPHCELPVALQPLQVGHYPAAGSDAWKAWLEDQIEQWGQEARVIGGITHPAAPPLNFDRPTLAA